MSDKLYSVDEVLHLIRAYERNNVRSFGGSSVPASVWENVYEDFKGVFPETERKMSNLKRRFSYNNNIKKSWVMQYVGYAKDFLSDQWVPQLYKKSFFCVSKEKLQEISEFDQYIEAPPVKQLNNKRRKVSDPLEEYYNELLINMEFPDVN